MTNNITLTSNKGIINLHLYDKTPKHKANFEKLVSEGYYNDLLFHRVIPNFMIQGGDPNSRNAVSSTTLGMGGPEYKVDAEFIPEYIHVRGALAAARQGDNMNPLKKSSGSQFYIVDGQGITDDMLDMIEKRNNIKYTAEQRLQYKMLGGTPFLDGDYTVFGVSQSTLAIQAQINELVVLKTTDSENTVAIEKLESTIKSAIETNEDFKTIRAISKAPKNHSDRPTEDIKMELK